MQFSIEMWNQQKRGTKKETLKTIGTGMIFFSGRKTEAVFTSMVALELAL